MEWAQENDAEIVSCDSLLFYRGMDIGTAKPSREEMSLIPHHCIDLVDAHQQFSIAAFLKTAKKAVDGILGRGKNVLVTGGSGFYLKGFVAPVIDAIVVPEKIENQVLRIQEEQGLPGLVDALKKAAPEDFDRIDLHNSRRVIPALKRCLASGKGIIELRNQVKNAPFPFSGFEVKSVLLERSLESLDHRVRERTGVMLNDGLIEEVERLIEQGFEANMSASLSIGYREVIAHLRGELNLEELEALINTNTMKLVKKQKKWFRHQMEFDQIINLDAGEPHPNDLFKRDSNA